ncbi:MAG: SIMPL domain-containing protein [Jatrophihabitans sp.]|uniref:SIMPL domain-containing protein n=1 Tax=Jatrophihabitans sp. TaxID=1932789 RepID=UPI003F7F3EFF
MEQPTIVVTGSAEREVAPDRFVVSGQVSVRAGDRAAAHAALAQRFTALDQAVLALGADDIEVRRSAISSWGEPGRLQRWTADRRLTLLCHDVERVTEVVATFGRVADVAMDGPHWSVDPRHPALAEVQAEAVRDARARAAGYALALGGELGRLVELRDHGGGGVPVRAAMAFRAKGGGEPAGLETLDLSPEPQLLTAHVETRWTLVLPA